MGAFDPIFTDNTLQGLLLLSAFGQRALKQLPEQFSSILGDESFESVSGKAPGAVSTQACDDVFELHAHTVEKVCRPRFSRGFAMVASTVCIGRPVRNAREIPEQPIDQMTDGRVRKTRTCRSKGSAPNSLAPCRHTLGCVD